MAIFSTYFWFSLIIFLVNQLLEHNGIFIPYVHSYLDDVLCAGIVLGFTLPIMQHLVFQDRSYRFGPWHLLCFVIWYSLLFEVIFPWEDPRHYADIWDVLAYAVGTLLFHFLGNRPTARLLILERS